MGPHCFPKQFFPKILDYDLKVASLVIMFAVSIHKDK